jgi:single-stranded-DNA-specific exonuclease
MRILKQFAPFGPGNMTPVFMAEGLQDTGYARGVGEDEKHLKASVSQKGSGPIGAIGFNLGDKLSLVKDKKPFDAVFSLDENEWNGSVSLQLKLRDIR